VVSAGQWHGTWQEYTVVDESILVSCSPAPAYALVPGRPLPHRHDRPSLQCTACCLSSSLHTVRNVTVQLAVPDSLDDDTAAQFLINPTTAVGLIDAAGVPKAGLGRAARLFAHFRLNSLARCTASLCIWT
jgi:NADPH:quinone reductase-like Zn-dependent oxidoreductase